MVLVVVVVTKSFIREPADLNCLVPPNSEKRLESEKISCVARHDNVAKWHGVAVKMSGMYCTMGSDELCFNHVKQSFLFVVGWETHTGCL